MTYKGTLADALSRVMDGLGRIEKSGTAPQAMGGFRFVPETAVMNALQPLLVEEQIVLSPRATLLRMDDYETQRGAQMHLATVALEMWARRGDEEMLWFTMLGQGADTQDKAIGKAITGAKKQGLLVANSVPTGDDPDAAHNEETTRRSTPRTQREERVAEVRQGVTLSDLRDRVLKVADQHAVIPSYLTEIIGQISGGKKFDDLTADELLALGKRIAAGEWDIPFEHEQSATTTDAQEASSAPTAQSTGRQEGLSGAAPVPPPAEPTLDDVLAVTGGAIEQPDGGAPPAAAPVSGGGAVPRSSTRDAHEAAEKARARAGR